MAFVNPDNVCHFTGRLGRDPEMRYTPGGSGLVKFSIAVDKRWKDAAGDPKTKTNWVPLTAWARSAELVSQLCKKGTLIQVTAEYDTSEYEKDGEKRYGHSFTVTSFRVLADGKPRGSGGEAENSGEGDEFGEEFPF